MPVPAPFRKVNVWRLTGPGLAALTIAFAPIATAQSHELSGIYAALGWEFAEQWITATRAEWSSGNRMTGLERRWRIAANIGRTLEFTPAGDAHVRLQYTYDNLGGYGEDHTVWLQCVLNLGAAHHGHEH